MSTAESEYMAACSVSKECCYLKSLLQEIGFSQHIKVYTDSTAALSMILNPVQRQKAKHFNVQYHWVRECHQNNRLSYFHLEGVKQPADMLTKALPQASLQRHLHEIGFGRISS